MLRKILDMWSDSGTNFLKGGGRVGVGFERPISTTSSVTSHGSRLSKGFVCQCTILVQDQQLQIAEGLRGSYNDCGFIIQGFF